MEITNVQTNDAQSFFSNFLKDNPEFTNESAQNQNQGGSSIGGNQGQGDGAAGAQAQQGGAKTQEELDAEKAKLEEEEKNKGTVQGALNAAGKQEEKIEEISDYKQLAEKLITDKILIGFEEGAKVENPDDFVDLLNGNIEFKVEQALEERWKEEVGSLSRDAQIILQYAKGGVTDAKDFAKLVNNLAARNEVAALDPSKESDQAQIVRLQLLNTGLSEAAVNETIEDLKASKKLEARAKEFFPSMKKAYDAQVQQSFKQKEQEEQERQSYIVTNATNVHFFLENEDRFLPFKIKDRNHKSLVYDLAAKPVGLDGDGQLIYGWQQHLQALQNGTEEQYKQFMKIMTFMANAQNYDEAVSRLSANQVNTRNFKTKEQGEAGKRLAIGSKENTNSGPGIRKSSSKIWSI